MPISDQQRLEIRESLGKLHDLRADVPTFTDAEKEAWVNEKYMEFLRWWAANHPGQDEPDGEWAKLEWERQVLAEPAPDLPQKTWARLADGTPLVTGEAPQSNKDVTQVVNTCLRPLPIHLSLLYRFAVFQYKQIIKVKRENSGLYSKTAKRRQRDRTML